MKDDGKLILTILINKIYQKKCETEKYRIKIFPRYNGWYDRAAFNWWRTTWSFASGQGLKIMK